MSQFLCVELAAIPGQKTVVFVVNTMASDGNKRMKRINDSMDEWNSDIILRVMEYVSYKDLNKFSQTAKRYYYLVHQMRSLLGTELVASTSKIPGVNTRHRTEEEVVEHALKQLRSEPTIALAFANARGANFFERLPRYLPPDCVIVGALSSSIQSSLPGQLECESTCSLFLGNFSSAYTKPFHLQTRQSLNEFLADLERRQDWKAFIIYGNGQSYRTAGSVDEDEVVQTLQARYPEAVIVGGICSGGRVTTPITNPPSENDLVNLSTRELLSMIESLGGGRPRSVEKSTLIDTAYNLYRERRYILKEASGAGAFGIALAGDVPIRSVVSRGVKSLTEPGVPVSEHRFIVSESVHHRPGDPEYMFRGGDSPPYHLIRRVQDLTTGNSLSPHDLMERYGQPNLVGLRGPGQDGFRLYPPHPLSMNLNGYLFIEGRTSTIADSMVGFHMDLLDIDGEACVEDMELTMRELSEQLKNEEILGAVMYSCNGRGPLAGPMIAEDMSDAKRFAREFPNVPCLGFYAGGEIGPEAVVGSSSVFRHGHATVQGFTCVLTLFIVPIKDLSNMNVDDSAESVDEFVRTRLSSR